MTTLASWIRAQIEELWGEIQRLAKLVTDDRLPAYGEGREGI
jgi:hypothetical protein